MLAIPVALIVAGYWIMYSGIKKVSMLDAFRCTAVQQQTPVPETIRNALAPAQAATLAGTRAGIQGSQSVAGQAVSAAQSAINRPGSAIGAAQAAFNKAFG